MGMLLYDLAGSNPITSSMTAERSRKGLSEQTGRST
jgi:hypothetical protein